jgi:hypothetical protein
VPGASSWDHRHSVRRGWPGAFPGWPACSDQAPKAELPAERGQGLGAWIRQRKERPLEPSVDVADGFRVDWTSGTPGDEGTRAEERRRRRRSRCLASGAGWVARFVVHPIAISFDDQCLPVMPQPVDQGRGQGVVDSKQGAPFPEDALRGQHDRAGFLSGGGYRGWVRGTRRPAILMRIMAGCHGCHARATGVRPASSLMARIRWPKRIVCSEAA